MSQAYSAQTSIAVSCGKRSQRIDAHIDTSFFSPGKDYVGPSWTWTSTRSIRYPGEAWAINDVTQADCDVHVEVELEDKGHPYGRVRNGHIFMASQPYRSDSMRLYTRENELILEDDLDFWAEIDLDWTVQLGEGERLLISDAPQNQKHPLWGSHGPLKDMYLVPLIQHGDPERMEQQTFGLSLIPFPDQGDDAWMRAGVFQCDATWILAEQCAWEILKVY